MKIERDNNYVCLTHEQYMLVIYNNGVIFEGVIVGENIRVSLTPKEKIILSNMFKTFVMEGRKIA